MRVRLARIEDAPALADIHVRSWQSGYKGLVDDSYLDSMSVDAYTSKWTDWLSGDMKALVAEEDEKPAGFSSFGPLRTPIPGSGRVPLYTSELYALYIHPDLWGRGTGRALVVQTADCLKNEGHNSMVLWVVKKNKRAIGLYKKMGGQACAKKKIKIGERMLDESAIGWRDINVILKANQI